MTIWENMVKIKRQILGEENMFGYKTTVVNQLCLMYHIYGKIFDMDETMNGLVKWVYLGWHYSGLVCAYISGLLFLQYGNKNDFIMLLYVLFAVYLCTVMSILLPLASYWYTSNIESMLAHMDDVLSKRKRSVTRINVKDLLINDMFILITSGLAYNFVCSFDVIFFYKEEKITNYTYYSFPLPCLEKYGSLTLYMISTVMVNTGVILPIIEMWTVFKFFEIWATVCYQEVLSIREDLKEQSENVIIASKDFSSYSTKKMKIQKMETDARFDKDLRNPVKAFQGVTKLINILIKFYELISSLMATTLFICQLTHAYIFLATDSALSVKCKEISLFLFTATFFFILCRVGEILDNLVTVMSFGVYEVPWYLLLPRFRKDILTVICQTQKRVNPKIMKVYLINVNMFGYLMRAVFSTTNVLASLMNK